MEEYTGRQIAIFADIHGLLEPAVAVLEDIKRRGITEIYSLGDNRIINREQCSTDKW